MKRRQRIGDANAPLATAEEAVLLARRAPASAWVCYLAGSVPFILGLLYFWSDMSRGAYAHERCAPAALGLALLFIVMKCGQAMYAGQLMDMVSQQARPWTWRRFRRMAWVQAAAQPFGMLLIPFSMLILIPFAYVYGYFQNLTVIGDGDDVDMKHLRKRAWELSKRDGLSHHLSIWLLSPWVLALAMILSFGVSWLLFAITMAEVGQDVWIWFVMGALVFVFVMWPLSPVGFALFINLLFLFLYIPELLRIFLGWDTVFRLSSGYAVANTTFLLAIYGVVYLCMDPIMKAAYVLRCFRGESLSNGRDLMVALQEVQVTREEQS